jgi:hypothetical protein
MTGFAAYPSAPLALILFAPVTFVLFGSFPPYRAAFLSLLIGMLVLPVGYGWEVPGLAVLDKSTIPVLSSVAACLLTAPRVFRRIRLRGATLLFVVGLAVGSLMTGLTNSDPYLIGGTVATPLTAWDGVGLFRWMAFSLILPFLLGRSLVREVAQLEQLLRPFVVGFLVYSLPMLWELRLSPQLHNTVYGYFPHSFAQQLRAGGYRPVVFIGHGLPLAILTSFAVLASTMLWRRGRRVLGLSAPLATSYLGGIVMLCKTMSAMLYASTGAIMFFCSAKTQLRVATAIACITLAYPLLRGADLFPTSMLSSVSSSASQDRSDSLAFRFKNEDLLLAHARERPLFGWGGYGRNLTFDDESQRASVPDGLWIILFGQLGAVGFLGIFGLMLWPILQCRRAIANVRSAADRRLLASFALLVALNWADSLPNALSGGVLMVFATGAFSGVVASYQTPRPEQPQPKKRAVPAAGGFAPGS